MQTTKMVSVIVPAYNGAGLLGETIQSVLEQTYPNFELLIVDDCSSDCTAAVVHQIDDTRVKCILHEENHGADKARLTGLQASKGEVIAFLDQDDLFHREKLQSHVAFLEEHPEVGFTYNARIAFNDSSKSIREIRYPPRTITLADLVLGFPFAPSDMVMRREWACREDIWEIDSHGSEIVFLGRLFLAGCQFGFVERVLNYRRYHSGRKLNNIVAKCAEELQCQEEIFTDPRCPPEVVALRNIGNANLYLGWAYYALAQKETATGQVLINKAIMLKPSILNGTPCELVKALAGNAISDESQEYEQLVQTISSQVPPTVKSLEAQWQTAIKRGYLLKGARSIMWGRDDDGHRFFTHALDLRAQLDKTFIEQLTYELLNYEAEFGSESMQKILERMTPYLTQIGDHASMRWLRGCLSVNQAFRNYHAHQYHKVPGNIWCAVVNEPRYLTNRGVLSMLFRSFVCREPLQKAA